MRRSVSVVDFAELSRFLVTGVTATLANLAGVWIARTHLPVQAALAAGMVFGMAVSYTMAKFFAFRSRTLDGIGGETTRFMIVYAFAVTAYWAVTNVARLALISAHRTGELADLGGVFFGAGAMAVVSYFGHRFFTYRTHR